MTSLGSMAQLSGLGAQGSVFNSGFRVLTPPVPVLRVQSLQVSLRRVFRRFFTLSLHKSQPPHSPLLLRVSDCMFMVYGLWFMVYGLWFMVYSLWFMVYGLWFRA